MSPHDDGIIKGDYVEQLTKWIFLKIVSERSLRTTSLVLV